MVAAVGPATQTGATRVGSRKSSSLSGGSSVDAAAAPFEISSSEELQGQNGGCCVAEDLSLSFCDRLALTIGVDAPQELRWRHGVNSQSRLARALADPKVHMLEADVCLGEFVAQVQRQQSNVSTLSVGSMASIGSVGSLGSCASGASGISSCSSTSCSSSSTAGLVRQRDRRGKRLVMAHYPTKKTSDLTLEDFLLQVMHHNSLPASQPKGIKLDFKRLRCVASGVSTLVHLHDQMVARIGADQRPVLLPVVFLNADVVRGPCYAPRLVGRWQEPLPASPFVQAVVEALSLAQRPQELNAALSLGWTMGLNVRSGAVLTHKMAEAMVAALPSARAALDLGVLRHISFAVSAAVAPASDRALARVLAVAGPSSSLTFYTPMFGRGVTRKEEEFINNYPLCPPYGLFLDVRLRAKQTFFTLPRLRPTRVLALRALARCSLPSLARCSPWGAISGKGKIKRDEALEEDSATLIGNSAAGGAADEEGQELAGKERGGARPSAGSGSPADGSVSRAVSSRSPGADAAAV